MRRSRALILTFVVALVTAAGPIVAAVYLAQQQGLNTEFERALGYARDVVMRSDRAVNQMEEARNTLIAANEGEPCSPEMLQLMRQLGVAMEYIKVTGHVAGTRMLCSTLGRHENGLEMGPSDSMTSGGSRLRLDSPLPLTEDEPFVSVEQGGFIAIAHRNQALDLAVDQEGVLLATFNPQTREVRTSLGAIDPQWIGRLNGEDEISFVDDDYIVGVVHSDEISLTGAIAAIPIEVLNQRVREFVLLLLPLGLFAGGGLTASVLYLARTQTSLASQIRAGLKRDEFFLVYQPVVDLSTRRWIGAEGLLRWRRPDGEIIFPDAFIPIAEQSGLINQLTARVLEKVRRDMSDLMHAEPDFHVSINLSARDLSSRRILSQLEELSWECCARPEQLMVEVTERMLVDIDEAKSAINFLRGRGIRVAIDDFGTGYCSLSYLETMQFDSLKIDRLFVEAIDTEAATNQVVLHIVEMSKSLGLEIVAEGVETLQQADYLRDKGVRYAQGWLFSKAIPVEEFLRGREQ